MNKLKNRNIFLIFTIILSLGITLGAVYFMYQYRDSRENKLSTGLISIDFKEKSNTIINLTSNVPVIDDIGLDYTPYEFTVTNTSNTSIDVDIKVDVNNNTSISLGAVRYGLYINDELVKKDYIHNDLILYTYKELFRDQSINCKIKFWVDYYYDRPNQTFIGKIKAEGKSRDKLYNGVTVTFDKGNLVYGLEDTDWINVSSDRKYKIENEVVTLYSDRDDGFMHTTGRVYLEAGKNYRFSAKSDATWGGNNSDNTVESFLMLDGQYNTYYGMQANSLNNYGYYDFTPTVTGTYHLRFDVNLRGNEHDFWDISVVEKDTSKETKEVGIGETYGKLPTPTRDGYTFMGWNGKNLAIFSPGILSENRIQNGITWHAKSENVVHISGTATGDSFLTEGMSSTSINLRKLSAGTYTISSNLVRTNSENVYIYGYYNGDTSSTTYAMNIINNHPKTFTISENAGTNIQMAINSGTTIDQEVWVQLEKGTIATEYEPYYITSSTKVVQKHNHTLKAIWKKNS